MIHAHEINPRDAVYLTGLVDGEGCFFISQPRLKGNAFCAFVIKMREDDRPLLEWCKEVCGGVGTITVQSRKNEWHPTARWEVRKKTELGVIRDLFELYPLKSKKQRDFEIWKHAVDFCIHCVGYRTDWTPVIEAKEQLAAVRAYVPSGAAA